MEEEKKVVVTKIAANPLLQKQNDENAILNVAAYCRVSTDSEEQLDSYKAQMAYYTDAIAKNPKWRFVGIYADEGITGLQAKKREQFLRMIKDCEKGKIDLILTKSVARFARNTVDSLKYIRKLRAKGVGVYFEEQSLNSLKADSEVFIGIHSVFAQSESENISANVKWGIRQRMQSGTFAFRYNLLGYKKGEDGKPEIVKEEADIIRSIYEMYLDGKSLDSIKKYLESNKFLTVRGSLNWSKPHIKSILTNERYAGDMLLQKTYIENCITKKAKKNNGELAKYLITNSHPAIIDRETFKLVQVEVARRGNIRKVTTSEIDEKGKYSGKYALSELLICGECGNKYRRITWKIKGKNTKVWRCVNRVEYGKKFCKQSVAVEEDKIKSAILKALRSAITDKKEVYDLILSNIVYGITGKKDDLDLFAIENEINNLKMRIDDNVSLMMKTEGDTAKYYEVISKMNLQIDALKGQAEIIKEKMKSNQAVSLEIKRITELVRGVSEEKDVFGTYDDTTVKRLIEYVRVMPDKKIVVVFKGGLTIESEIE